MDCNVRVDSDSGDEDGFLVGRQGQVSVLVEGFHEAADELVRRADGQRQTTGRHLPAKNLF